MEINKGEHNVCENGAFVCFEDIEYGFLIKRFE